jgi:hypothetical protein
MLPTSKPKDIKKAGRSSPKASIKPKTPIKRSITTIRVRPIKDLNGIIKGILMWNTFFQREILNELKGQDGATNYTLFNDTYNETKNEWEECFFEAIQEKVEKNNMSFESITRIDYIFKPEWASVIFL